MSTLMNDAGRSWWTNIQRGTCVLALSALAACASRMDGAPVVDRTGVAPGLANTAPGGLPPGPPPPGFYQVQPGDTLYRVALKNGQNYRDIATWNNLTNPNQIEVGQVLRVAPPGSTPGTPGVATTPLDGSAVQSTPLGASGAPQQANGSGYPSPYANGGAAGASGASGYPSPYAGNNPTAPNTIPAAPGMAPTTLPPDAAAAGAAAGSTAAPAVAGAISFMWPVRGQIVHGFDGNKSKGIDIAGTAGTPILAAAGGRVLYSGSELRGYGNLIIIKHDDHFLTAYAHNRVLLVKNNDVVTKGQKIAEMGDTQADRVMLHFEVRKDSTPVDPMKYLPPQ